MKDKALQVWLTKEEIVLLVDLVYYEMLKNSNDMRPELNKRYEVIDSKLEKALNKGEKL